MVDKERASSVQGKSANLEVELGGETVAQKTARLLADGVAGNALVAKMFAKGSGLSDGDSLQEVYQATKDAVEATRRGGTEQADTLLTSQAIALNAMFVELSRRAVLNMGEYMGATETYLRLALKAQSQCRTTLESLAEIRNPRSVAFVRQANIAAGHQQVNNGGATGQPFQEPARVETLSTPNKLFEEKPYGNTLDARAKGKARRSNPPLEAVGAVHRPENG